VETSTRNRCRRPVAPLRRALQASLAEAKEDLGTWDMMSKRMSKGRDTSSRLSSSFSVQKRKQSQKFHSSVQCLCEPGPKQCMLHKFHMRSNSKLVGIQMGEALEKDMTHRLCCCSCCC